MCSILKREWERDLLHVHIDSVGKGSLPYLIKDETRVKTISSKMYFVNTCMQICVGSSVVYNLFVCWPNFFLPSQLQFTPIKRDKLRMLSHALTAHLLEVFFLNIFFNFFSLMVFTSILTHWLLTYLVPIGLTQGPPSPSQQWVKVAS